MNQAGPIRPAFFFYHLLWDALDWLFPPECGGCSVTRERWCATCRSATSWISASVCPRCGAPQQSQTLCEKCLHAPPEYDALRSSAVYAGPLRQAMHRMKYNKDMGLGEALAQHLTDIYQRSGWQADVVAPVPISAQRRKERGYNQAGLLARPMAYAVSVPYAPDILRKCRDTRSQVGLSAQQRVENVSGAFEAVPALVRGKRVLIIDDVTTTGSTIRACAQALRSAGASAVFGLTLARAANPQADADDLPNPTLLNGGTYGG